MAAVMKIVKLATLSLDLVTRFVSELSERTNTPHAAKFDSLPTRMIFPPERGFPSSLHYMWFPRGSCQRFHWHPGGRHLIVCGDTELQIRHNSLPETGDPNVDPTTDVIEPGVVAVIRFPSLFWHEFSTPSASGIGVVAFSFHDKDDLISTSLGLMEELTTFFDPTNNQKKEHLS